MPIAIQLALLTVFASLCLSLPLHARPAPPGASETEPSRIESALASRHPHLDIEAMERDLPAKAAALRQLEALAFRTGAAEATENLWAALTAHYDTAPHVEDRELAPVRHLIHLGQRLKREGDRERSSMIAESLRSHLEARLSHQSPPARGLKGADESRARSLEALATVYEKLLDRSLEAELLYFEAYTEEPTNSRSAIRGLQRVRGGTQETVDLSEAVVEHRRSGKPVEPRLQVILQRAPGRE